MKVCVVTGGMGGGKSAVCSMMSRIYGAPVYDADSRVKELYSAHPSLLEDIEAALKTRLRDGEGRFLPSLLADRIFSDVSELETVEGLVFPALEEDFECWKADMKEHDFVVFESATVLEKAYFSGFGDIVLLVDAPMEVRLERAVVRDGTAREKVLSRMRNQPLMNRISRDDAEGLADYVLVNDSSLDSLEQKVRAFVESYIIS